MNWPLALPVAPHVHISTADQPDDLDEVRYEHHLKHRGQANHRIFYALCILLALFLLLRLTQRCYQWWGKRRIHTYRYTHISSRKNFEPLSRIQAFYNASAARPFPRVFGCKVTSFSIARVIFLISYPTILILFLISVNAPQLSQHFLDDVTFRAAWLTLTQIPLVYLLSAKRGPLNFIAGLSHDRLNWMHRWIGRCLFLSATTHAVIMKSSISSRDIIHSEDRSMVVVRYGIAAYSLLLWIAVSSILPIRRWSYRCFCINHFISSLTFLAVAFQHVPTFARAPLYLSAGILCLDKLLTPYFFVRNNISIAPPLRRLTKFGRGPGRARLIMGFPVRMSAPSILLQSLPNQTVDTTTIIRITSIPFSWKPGQHIRLYVPALGRWEIHPFTPANCSSAPAPPLPPRKDVDVEIGTTRQQPKQTSELLLLVKAKAGLTKRLADYHKSWLARPCPNATRSTDEGLTAYIDGPYGSAPEWHEYENLVLVASSTGVSFVLAVLDHLEQLCLTGDSEQLQTKNVKVVWIVRHLDPIFEDLVTSTIRRCAATLEDFGVRVKAEFYTTCSESQPRHEMQEYDAFAHLRPPMRRNLSDRAPLRIRHPDEIYEEWDREAEIEALKWAESWVEDVDGYDTYGEESDETSTFIDEQRSRKNSEDQNWMEGLDDEDDPFSDEHAYTTSQAPSIPQRQAGEAESEETLLCQCALIQHQRRKTQPHPKHTGCISTHHGIRPNVARILEDVIVEGRTMVAVCSNSSVVRDARAIVAKMNGEYAWERRNRRVELHVEVGS